MEPQVLINFNVEITTASEQNHCETVLTFETISEDDDQGLTMFPQTTNVHSFIQNEPELPF